MADQLTKEQFVERFIAHCLKECGFTHFDDGTPVAAYASEVAESYFADPEFGSEGPEVCAESDMDYWGES